MHLIRDILATTEDIQLAGKCYGPELGSIKGKTAQSKPVLVTSRKIETLEELLRVNNKITLSIDSINENGLNFLIAISHDLHYWSAARLMTTGTKDVYECAKEIHLLCKRHDFGTKEIFLDSQFRKALCQFGDD